jgi:hypothetical protein
MVKRRFTPHYGEDDGIDTGEMKGYCDGEEEYLRPIDARHVEVPLGEDRGRNIVQLLREEGLLSEI